MEKRHMEQDYSECSEERVDGIPVRRVVAAHCSPFISEDFFPPDYLLSFPLES